MQSDSSLDLTAWRLEIREFKSAMLARLRASRDRSMGPSSGPSPAAAPQPSNPVPRAVSDEPTQAQAKPDRIQQLKQELAERLKRAVDADSKGDGDPIPELGTDT